MRIIGGEHLCSGTATFKHVWRAFFASPAVTMGDRTRSQRAVYRKIPSDDDKSTHALHAPKRSRSERSIRDSGGAGWAGSPAKASLLVQG